MCHSSYWSNSIIDSPNYLCSEKLTKYYLQIASKFMIAWVIQYSVLYVQLYLFSLWHLFRQMQCDKARFGLWNHVFIVDMFRTSEFVYFGVALMLLVQVVSHNEVSIIWRAVLFSPVLIQSVSYYYLLPYHISLLWS